MSGAGSYGADVRPDTGYTKVCSCGGRHGEKPQLIGVERYLEIADCPKCDRREIERIHLNQLRILKSSPQ